jgi:hypothetical protein
MSRCRPITGADTDVSLKAFHLFFVAVCVLLAAFVAAWATGQYRVLGETVYVVTAIGAALTGAALAVYGAAFQRKMRRL